MSTTYIIAKLTYCPWVNGYTSFDSDEHRLETIKHLYGRCVNFQDLSKRTRVMLSHAAAHAGHIQSLTYLHEICGCPLEFVNVNDDSFNSAVIRGGNIDCLKYGHKHGVDISSVYHIKLMAIYDCVDMLQYIYEHGIPWPDDICDSATTSTNDFDCLIYLHQHGAPWTKSTSDLVCAVIRCGILLHILDYTTPYSRIISYAIDNGLPPPSKFNWNELMNQVNQKIRNRILIRK